MITAEILRNIAPNIRNAQQVATQLNAICPQYGINTPDIMHEFLANVLEECGEFRVFSESLNYTPDRLIEVFGSKRITRAQANTWGRTATQPANQRALANHLYGGSWGRTNLGNTHPDDGWNFRGSGPIQITGRSNITRFATYYNNRFAQAWTLEQMAEALRQDLGIGIHSACWIFAVSKNLIQLSIDDQMERIVRRINGGLTNFAKRIDYYERCKRFIR